MLRKPSQDALRRCNELLSIEILLTLPDGNVVTITEEQQFELRYKLESDLERLNGEEPLRPWDIDWSKLKNIPTSTEIRWLVLGFCALGIPIFVWLATELAELVGAWVKRGET